jgi:hypothetical protein
MQSTWHLNPYCYNITINLPQGLPLVVCFGLQTEQCIKDDFQHDYSKLLA